MTLFEINERVAAILESGYYLDEETGEFIEAGEDLDALQIERTEKLEAVALYLKNENAITAALKAEKDALTKRIQAHEKKAERVNQYLAASLAKFDEKCFETPKAIVKIRRSEGVVVWNEDAVPDEYKRTTTKITVSPDLAAIKKAINGGAEINGAYIEKRIKAEVK